MNLTREALRWVASLGQRTLEQSLTFHDWAACVAYAKNNERRNTPMLVLMIAGIPAGHEVNTLGADGLMGVGQVLSLLVDHIP